jgi:hypothetical protein
MVMGSSSPARYTVPAWLVASGYFFPLLFGTYTITGAALLTGRFRAARVDCARAGHREHRRRPPLPRSIRISTYNPRRRA